MQRFVLCVFFITWIVCEVFAQSLPVDTTKGWKLTWSDEFDYPDSELEKNWISQNSASGGYVLCSRWRENARVHDGILELMAKKESRGGQDWTCGNVWTKEKFGYGYFECRYKYAGATGTNNSFWTWTGGNLPDGQQAIEIDVNEGHYPNVVNTNIHNWSSKHSDGSHDYWSQRFVMSKEQVLPAYTHVFDTPIRATKIRFSSTHGEHFHIGEFRIYAPNAAGYPSRPETNDADSQVAGLINLTRTASPVIRASGSYVVQGRSTAPENVADGKNMGNGVSWIAQDKGEKWLEISFSEPKEVGCIQFTNGWFDGSMWKSLIHNYKLEYFDGHKWSELASFDTADGADFAEEYHTYGLLWTPEELKYYFDGELIRTFQHEFVHAPTRIYLSLAILSANIAGEVTDAIDGTSMKIDYVRYYTQNKETGLNLMHRKDIRVYPNPVKDRIYYSTSARFSKIKIFDIHGIISMEETANTKGVLDTSQLRPGVYVIVFESENSNERIKFIKQG